MSFVGSEAATWRRDAYTVALIGPESIPHEELVSRAGYQVVTASTGDAASDMFARGTVVDAMVLDFSTDGRPPEAVLLFARRTSAGAPVVAIVPPDKNEAYRRAFLAGARDVLPAPPRGEDLLAAVDLVLEPRGLADVVEELRALSFEDDEGTVPLAKAPDPTLSRRIVKLEHELTKRKDELERLRRQGSGTAQFRQQALDAITARDRALESRERVKHKLAQARRELKEKTSKLELTEHACEELQRKLKEARDSRRHLETRLQSSESRTSHLEGALDEADLIAVRPPLLQGEKTEQTAEPPAPVSFAVDSFDDEASELDVEAALSARDADERRLEEMEAVYRRYQASLARIRELEAALDGRYDLETVPIPVAEDPEEALAARGADEERLAELDAAHEERLALVSRIEELEGQIRQRDAELRAAAAVGDGDTAITLEVALAELDSVREAHAEALGTLDAVRQDRDGLRRQLSEVEVEAADAETRLEELHPLAEEVERLRRELMAERAGHQATRARLEGQARGASDERSPAAVWKEADRLQFELDRAQAEVVDLQARRDELEARILGQERELESLRVAVAALQADRGGHDGPTQHDSAGPDS